MPFPFRNPALEAFVEALPQQLAFAQVLIRKDESGFVLTHVKDEETASLREVTTAELRRIAQFTERGEFRPLKSAPSLQRGWRHRAGNVEALGAALDVLYPGAVADWFAARQPKPPVTDYRAFTNRQTGMYRITTHLPDARVAQVTAAACAPRFCLKQRLWAAPALAADSFEAKSAIPCLEPCALLLEFARTVARMDQQVPSGKAVPRDEAAAAAAVLREELERPSNVREADFSVPSNPRRLLLALETIQSVTEYEKT